MKKGIFEGASEKGSIEEAITNAIAEAKKSLEAELITWELDSLSGENGGIAPANIVTALIKAKSKTVKVKKTKAVKEIKVKAVKTKEVKVKKADKVNK